MASTIPRTVAPLVEPGLVPVALSSSFAGQRIHMIGIGGCGMSGLAEVLARRGASVRGTDRSASPVTMQLQGRGIPIDIAPEPGALPPRLDLVVASSAVPESHPQLAAARAAGCRVMKYAQLLGALMQESVGVAVAGTHGKSTTTAWTAYLLREAGLDPTFVVGAHVPQLGSGAGVGSGEHFVAEACEYDRSFQNLHFRYAVILNVEEDHLDFYGSAAEIETSFAAFAGKIDPDGVLLVNGDDAGAMRVAGRADCRIETFGLGPDATWRANELDCERGCYSFDLEHDGQALVRVALGLAGKHSVYNALATAALARYCGVEPAAMVAPLRDFDGAHRRLTHKGCCGGVTILDDYAHHPTELRATLDATRQRYEPRKLWVVFQPHQHSRTRFFLDDFAASFAAADVVVVPDIYFVRDSEAERHKVGANDLVDRIRIHGREARYCPQFDAIVNMVAAEVEPGDVVVTMGAGDIWQVADELVERLGSNR